MGCGTTWCSRSVLMFQRYSLCPLLPWWWGQQVPPKCQYASVSYIVLCPRRMQSLFFIHSEYSATLKAEAAWSAKTLVYIYQTTWNRIRREFCLLMYHRIFQFFSFIVLILYLPLDPSTGIGLVRCSLLNLLMIVFWCRNWIHPSVFSMQGPLIACQQLVLVWTCWNYQSLGKKSFWETNCCMLYRLVLVLNWAK